VAFQRNEFHHSVKTRFGILLLVVAAIWATFVVADLPLEGVLKMLTAVPFALFLFGAYRFYLTFRSVVIDGETLEMRHPGFKRTFTFADVEGLRFDSYPHDLVVKTDGHEYRLPRTLEGFRNLHELMIEKTHRGEHEKLPLEVRVRRSLRFVSLFAITLQLIFGYFIVQRGFNAFTFALGTSLAVATFVFLDNYCLRRCIFQHDGLWVHGLLGRKFYPHATLRETEVKKTSLWSRMRLKFGNSTVTLEDRVMDLPVVRMARIVEHEWGHGVHGVKKEKAA